MPEQAIPSMSCRSLYSSLRESCRSEVDKYYLNYDFTNVDPEEREDYIGKHFDKGKELIEGVLDQFRWIHVLEPDSAEGTRVTSWTHCSMSDLSKSDGGYLVVNETRLLGYLEWYFEDQDSLYIRSLEFDWAIADMLVYTECRLMSLQGSRIIPVPGLNTLSARIFVRKEKLLSMLRSSQTYANSVYAILGLDPINWIDVATKLEYADRNGVGWRKSIKYTVEQLASSGPA